MKIDEDKKKLIDILKRIPTDLKPGDNIEVICPCGGKLRVSCAILNGHIHASCCKCGIQIMQ